MKDCPICNKPFTKECNEPLSKESDIYSRQKYNYCTKCKLFEYEMAGQMKDIKELLKNYRAVLAGEEEMLHPTDDQEDYDIIADEIDRIDKALEKV